MIGSDPLDFVYALFIFPVSLSVHEYAHAWVAYRYGDDTAASMGRLTLNPVAHISLFGTIILPLLVGFGWAKPVPVNFAVLNRSQIFKVAAAGPASNILMAFGLAVSFHLFRLRTVPLLGSFVWWAILYNIILAVFNLLPIPPLDGSRMVFARLKSPESIRAYRQVSQFGLFILIGFLLLGGFEKILWPVVELLFKLLGLPLP